MTPKPPPKPPRGSPQLMKREWRKLVRDLENRGIDPHERVLELEIWIQLVGEEFDLNDCYGGADLRARILIGTRFSAIANQKLRIRNLLFQDGGKS